MDVRADGVAVDRALATVLAVVAGAAANAAERPDTDAEPRPPAMILEPDDRLRARTGLRLPIDDDVADAAPDAVARMFRIEVEDARTRQLRARCFAIEAAEELVRAAHREQRHIGFDRLAHSGCLRGDQILGDGALLAILRAPGEDQIMRLRVESVAQPKLGQFEADAARLAATAQAHDVAAVAIDVHEPRVQMRDAKDGRGAHPSSQKRCLPPSRASNSRTSSIAVYVGTT